MVVLPRPAQSTIILIRSKRGTSGRAVLGSTPWPIGSTRHIQCRAKHEQGVGTARAGAKEEEERQRLGVATEATLERR